VDFAGGIVVHATAGIAALTSVFVVGKRIIHHDEDLRPHNIPFVALGTALLWFGWFGFNSGSALAANGVAAFAFANTNIAASVAMVAWFLIAWAVEKRPSFVAALTGAVAGLATVTPAAGYVQPWGAFLIGLFAAVACYLAVTLKNRFQWDDALDVWGVHGVGGIVGTLCLGLFASSAINGISGLWMGDYHQFLVQLYAVIVTVVYSFVVTYVSLKVINVFTPVRVEEREEIEGLDICLHGETAYLLGELALVVTADRLQVSGGSRAV
jgi:Amt family ammonium transporter